jgi:Flp pilus assembly pilin Flp
LIVAGISLAIVASLFVFGDSLQDLFDAMPAAMQAASDEVETGR